MRGVTVGAWLAKWEREQPTQAEYSDHLAIAVRSDGYVFVLRRDAGGKLRIHAGCRNGWLLGQYKRHARRCHTRGKLKETLAIIAALEATAKAKWSK